MRTAFFGTSEYAVAVLERLAGSEFAPQLVVTPPDRPRGRGRRVAPPPAAEAAAELGIELLQVESVNEPEAVERLRAAALDAVCVCAFGQLIREPLITELELLNVHPSLLPRWRGAAPIERAILAGDERTGVTIMRVTEGLDSGPIALQETVGIEPDDDYGRLAGRLATLGGELMVRALELHSAGKLELSDQDDEQATYAEKISADERRLDPGRPAPELARRVRALTPHVGAYLELDGSERLGVLEAAAEESGPPLGEVAVLGGAPVIGCADGGLRLLTVKPQGRGPMAADAYLRGHELPALAGRD